MPLPSQPRKAGMNERPEADLQEVGILCIKRTAALQRCDCEGDDVTERPEWALICRIRLLGASSDLVTIPAGRI